MKKKIFFIILLFFVGCGVPNQKLSPESDTITYQPTSISDSILPDTLRKDTSEIVAVRKNKKMQYEKDFLFDSRSKKIRQSILKEDLDTTSILPKMEQNLIAIDTQQKQLDSLIKTKKRK